MEERSDPCTGELSNRSLLDGAVELRWRIEQLEAELLGMVGEIRRRGAHEDDGAVSLVTWLRTRCRFDRGRAGELVRLARAGDEHPELGEAHREGRVTGCEVRRIASGTESVRRDMLRHGTPEEVVDRSVAHLRADLLESAENGEGPQGLRREIDSRRHQLSADAMSFDEWVAFEQRELYFCTTFGGMVDLRGTLDPLSAATVRAAVEALSARDDAPGDTTAGQRRADALVQLADRALESGTLPRARRQRPHVGVTVSQTSLRTPSTVEGADAAQLHGHGPSSADAARLLACDGEVRRLVVGPASEVLDVGRSTRVVPPSLFNALSVRDGGCTHPRCDRPPEWCDAHHVVHWAHGGTTDLDNLVLLCRKHHTATHLRDGGGQPPGTSRHGVGFRDPPPPADEHHGEPRRNAVTED